MKLINYIILKLKTLLPKTLLIRTMLIISIILIITQSILIGSIYDRLWRQARSSLVSTITDNIILIVSNVITNAHILDKNHTTYIADNVNVIYLHNLKLKKFKHNITSKINNYYKNSILKEVRANTGLQVFAQDKQKTFHIYVQLNNAKFLHIQLSQNNFLITSSKSIFLIILLSNLIILLLIYQFIRLQIRPLYKLSQAARKFGKGEKVSFIPKSGSIEIQEATSAFNEMRLSIEKFIELRTMMLSSISHDLKTSLTKMNLIIDINKTEENEDLANNLKKELSNMNNMIVSYLDFAKEETQYTIPASIINLQQLLTTIIDTSQIENFDITLKYETLNKNIKAVPLNIKRVLENLINNAHQQNASICNIKVKDYSKTYINIEIEDNGPGIKPEYYQQVFKPFYKINKARTSNQSGSVGLGLFIVKNLILKTGGRIDLGASKKLGGLKVSILLPKE